MSQRVGTFSVNDKAVRVGRNPATGVESFLDIIKETLASGEEVKVSGFGKFVVHQKKDRLGRNPQTGESLTITARKILTFKPSILLKQEINGE